MRKLENLFFLCNSTALKLCLERSTKRCQSEGLCSKPKDVNKPGMFLKIAQFAFYVKNLCKVIFQISKIGDFYILLNCLSQKSRNSDNCF